MSGLILGLLPVVIAASPNAATVLNDDGAWCWFQDERAVVHDGRLLVGSVAAGTYDPRRRGDIELTQIELGSGDVQRQALFDSLEVDDHDAPALWVRPDGRILAVFAMHGKENRFYYRISTGRAVNHREGWGPLQYFSPSPSSRISYSNLLFLATENGERGRLYNFYRGLNDSFKPSYAWSDDWGETWYSGNVVIDVPARFRHRPYVKYASGVDRLDLFYTEGHPRDFDNSVYHIFYRDGMLHRSDGGAIRRLTQGLREPGEGTRLFVGDADNVAWVSDAHVTAQGTPYVVFSVQKDSAHLPSGDPAAGQDHRYYYAHWDGRQWRCHEVAYGGSRLYPGEDDYTGNVCLHTTRLNTLFLSTNADPRTGRPLISKTDRRRHYELFRGETPDGGSTWQWQAITADSAADNLRPLVPQTQDSRSQTLLLWLRGQYASYRDFRTEIVMLRLD